MLAAALPCLVFPPTAGARTETRADAGIDPAIVAVVSDASWETDEALGSYRVILRSEGFEHVSSGLVAEWVADPSDANEPAHVVLSTTLVEPGLYRFGAPMLTRMKGHVRINIEGVNTYASAQRVHCIFDLLPDKTVVVVRACL